MKLSFYPRGDSSPMWPGRGQGQYGHAGRTFDPKTRANVPDDKPFEVATVDGNGNPTLEADHFRTLCARDGDCLPADEATAKFCGVPFVKPEKGENGWELPRSKKSEDKKGSA